MKKIILLLLPVYFISCSDKSTPAPDGTVFSENFVQIYIEPNSFNVIRPDTPPINTITLEAKGTSISQNDARFKDIAQEYNDISYNRNIVPNTNVCMVGTLQEVDIIAVNDFNEQHPQGSSLTDIVTFKSSSPYNYIQAGYSTSNQESSTSEYRPSVEYDIIQTVNGKLDKEYPLIYRTMSLDFAERPSNPDAEIKITLKITNKTISYQFKFNN